MFDSVFVTTGGGPNDATNTLMVLAVKEGLQFFNVGYASAIGNITLLFIATMAAVLLLVVRRADVGSMGSNADVQCFNPSDPVRADCRSDHHDAVPIAGALADHHGLQAVQPDFLDSTKAWFPTDARPV